MLKRKFIKKEDVVAGDLCVVDSSGNKKFMRFSDKITAETITELGVTPIGVVVIPTSHDVYGTGECAVISLNGMSYSTPDVGCSGTSHQSMYWGGGMSFNTQLPNLTRVNIIGAASAQTDTITTSNCCYLPSDSFTGTTCVKDENANYESTETTDCGPSPYLTDGSRNPQYYDTSVSSLNALADFDGTGNTVVLLDLATGQSDWQTADTITNKSSSGYTPAACCCWRYSTVGTSQGDWYLPACGELGYVCARRGIIDTVLQSIIDNQLVESCSTVGANNFFSSSEYAPQAVFCVSTTTGYVKNYTKTTGRYVRAFCRV